MLALAARWQVSSFVYLSSVPVIGLPRELPITEEHPVQPPTAYHASKLFGEHLCSVARAAGTPTVGLRLTAPVGPGMPDGRILPVFVRRALAGEPLELAGEGTRGQDYVDVRDIAAAVEAAIEAEPSGVLNIASGTCTTNLELAHSCVEVLGSASDVLLSGRPDPEDGVRWEVSIERAAASIDYRPSHSLKDSITAVAEELRGNPDRGSIR
jgi:UDP-glucose 4-epimerase